MAPQKVRFWLKNLLVHDSSVRFYVAIDKYNNHFFTTKILLYSLWLMEEKKEKKYFSGDAGITAVLQQSLAPSHYKVTQA